MKIHTDKLTETDLWRELPSGLDLEVIRRGSRSRDHAFDVGISAQHGADSHGIKRVYARNSGQYGANGNYDRAATYIEWGDWMVALFKIDPQATIGPYGSPGEFVRMTQAYAPHRPDRESAPTHADRWASELADL